MSPEAALVVEMGAQRQASHSLVKVRCTPMSRDGSAIAAPAISRNHGPGTITEPQVTSPRGKVQEGAVRAVTCAKVVDMGHHGAAEWPAKRSLDQGHSQSSTAELSRAVPKRDIGANIRRFGDS